MKWHLPLLTLLMGSFTVSAANWPAWRGPHGDGLCDETGLPMHWSATENLAWAVELPERGIMDRQPRAANAPLIGWWQGLLLLAHGGISALAALGAGLLIWGIVQVVKARSANGE